MILPLNGTVFLFKYADDTTLILPHFSTSTDASSLIKSKIQHMQNWCQENNLTLNASKTQVMSINKKRNFTRCEIDQPHLKILGVTFNRNLKWDEQINFLIRKSVKTSTSFAN